MSSISTGGHTCLTCGGLIMEPGITYGWAGKVCYCPEPPGRFRRRAGEESQVGELSANVLLEKLKFACEKLSEFEERIKELELVQSFPQSQVEANLKRENEQLRSALIWIAGDHACDDTDCGLDQADAYVLRAKEALRLI